MAAGRDRPSWGTAGYLGERLRKLAVSDRNCERAWNRAQRLGVLVAFGSRQRSGRRHDRTSPRPPPTLPRRPRRLTRRRPRRTRPPRRPTRRRPRRSDHHHHRPDDDDHERRRRWGAPPTPPVEICGNESVLAGPSSPPAGAVTVPAGNNSKLSLDKRAPLTGSRQVHTRSATVSTTRSSPPTVTRTSEVQVR